MKRILLFIVLCFFISIYGPAATAQKLDGAWKKITTAGSTETTCIVADNYFMQAEYSIGGKQFVGTMGGVFLTPDDKTIQVTVEFDTENKEQVGQQYTIGYSLDEHKLIVDIQGEKSEWQRIDEGKGPLAGNWRITEREDNGKMNKMQPGPRKTIKILSASRFQWAAINPQTKEFFGTGGGRYTFSNGKYAEKIEFFSRDGSRVGMSLTFKGEVEGNRWRHSGKSSKGDPVAEVWQREGR